MEWSSLPDAVTVQKHACRQEAEHMFMTLARYYRHWVASQDAMARYAHTCSRHHTSALHPVKIHVMSLMPETTTQSTMIQTCTQQQIGTHILFRHNNRKSPYTSGNTSKKKKVFSKRDGENISSSQLQYHPNDQKWQREKEAQKQDSTLMLHTLM